MLKNGASLQRQDLLLDGGLCSCDFFFFYPLLAGLEQRQGRQVHISKVKGFDMYSVQYQQVQRSREISGKEAAAEGKAILS